LILRFNILTLWKMPRIGLFPKTKYSPTIYLIKKPQLIEVF